MADRRVLQVALVTGPAATAVKATAEPAATPEGERPVRLVMLPTGGDYGIGAKDSAWQLLASLDSATLLEKAALGQYWSTQAYAQLAPLKAVAVLRPSVPAPSALW